MRISKNTPTLGELAVYVGGGFTTLAAYGPISSLGLGLILWAAHSLRRSELFERLADNPRLPAPVRATANALVVRDPVTEELLQQWAEEEEEKRRRAENFRPFGFRSLEELSASVSSRVSKEEEAEQRYRNQVRYERAKPVSPDYEEEEQTPDYEEEKPVRKSAPPREVPRKNVTKASPPPPEEETRRPGDTALPTPGHWDLHKFLRYVNELPDEAPHLLVIAPSGAGKTVAVASIVATRTGKVVIIDPKKRPGKWGGVTCVGLKKYDPAVRDKKKAAAGVWKDVTEAVDYIYGELIRRLNIFQETPEGEPLPFDELTVVVDEAPMVAQEVERLFNIIAMSATIGRECRFRLIVISTSDRVGALGIEGYGDIRDSYKYVYLGNPARAKLGIAPVDEEEEDETLFDPARREYIGAVEVRGRFRRFDLDGALELKNKRIPPARWFALPGIVDSIEEIKAQAARLAETIYNERVPLALPPAPSEEEPSDEDVLASMFQEDVPVRARSAEYAHRTSLSNAVLAAKKAPPQNGPERSGTALESAGTSLGTSEATIPSSKTFQDVPRDVPVSGTGDVPVRSGGAYGLPNDAQSAAIRKVLSAGMSRHALATRMMERNNIGRATAYQLIKYAMGEAPTPKRSK